MNEYTDYNINQLLLSIYDWRGIHKQVFNFGHNGQPKKKAYNIRPFSLA